MFVDTVRVTQDSLVAFVQHYGTEYTMVDYKTKAHNAYLLINVSPTEKLNLSLAASLSKSTAAYDPVVMPDITDRLEGALVHQVFSFDHMHEYSDLDYRLVRFSPGVRYLFSPSVTSTSDVDYADLEDRAGYVYGLESGSLFTVRSGVSVTF